MFIQIGALVQPFQHPTPSIEQFSSPETLEGGGRMIPKGKYPGKLAARGRGYQFQGILQRTPARFQDEHFFLLC